MTVPLHYRQSTSWLLLPYIFLTQFGAVLWVICWSFVLLAPIMSQNGAIVFLLQGWFYPAQLYHQISSWPLHCLHHAWQMSESIFVVRTPQISICLSILCFSNLPLFSVSVLLPIFSFYWPVWDTTFEKLNQPFTVDIEAGLLWALKLAEAEVLCFWPFWVCNVDTKLV